MSVLDHIESLTESWDVELKSAQGANGKGALPNDFWPTYSAFANTHGGYIILGVEETDVGFRVLGIQEPDRVEQDLWNNLNNPQKVSANLLGRSSVTRRDENGRTVLVVKVPRAERSHRPVYTGGNPLSGSYRRLNQADSKCPPIEVHRMLADASSSQTRDAQTLDNFTRDDLDIDSVRTYRNLLASHNPNHPFLQSDDNQLLKQVKALSTNRETGQEGLTVAGLLMLGKYSSIRDFYPQFFLDFRELAVERNRGAEDRWIDRITPDGTWAGNLLSFYLRVLPKLTAGLRVPYKTNANLFRTEETIIHTALKEALVNSLVHADHGGSTSIRIFRSVDKFEFFNPGVLLIDPDSLLTGGRSESRNPILQDMFRLIGIGERAGSGVPAILQAWRDQHWRLPTLEDDIARGETHLVLSMISLFPAEIVEQLTSRFGDRFRQLSEPERLALCLAASEGGVTNRQLQKLSEEHGRDITYMLRDLVNQGFLVPHGERQGRKYSIPQSQTETPHQAIATHPGSEQSAEGSEHSTPSSEQSPSEVVSLVLQVRTKQRAAKGLVKEAIFELCSGSYKTVADIAEALDRSKDTVRVHYVSKMVQDGSLALLYPDRLNHPDQAYTMVTAPEENHEGGGANDPGSSD